MTPHEAAQLLALAVKYDPRLTERTPEDVVLAAKAWAAAVRAHIPTDFATAYVVRHYGTPGAMDRPRLSPSDINGAWSKQQRARRDTDTMKAITSAQGIPPTTAYLAAREALRKARA
jgi:hypothetical protein